MKQEISESVLKKGFEKAIEQDKSLEAILVAAFNETGPVNPDVLFEKVNSWLHEIGELHWVRAKFDLHFEEALGQGYFRNSEAPKEPKGPPEGMIPFQMRGSLGEFEEAYMTEISLLQIEDLPTVRNLVSSIWQFGNQEFTKGKKFSEESIGDVVGLFEQVGIFTTEKFPDSSAEIHLLKLIKEAKEAIESPRDVEELADIHLALIATAWKRGVSFWDLHIATRAKLEKIGSLEWVKEPDGTYQSIKPSQSEEEANH